MKMIEVRVREQHQIDRWQIFDLEPRAFDPFQQEYPVRKVGIYQDVQVVELRKERGVADPSQCNLPALEHRKSRDLVLAGSFRQKGFPHHLPKERSRVEMIAGCELFERARKTTLRFVCG